MEIGMIYDLGVVFTYEELEALLPKHPSCKDAFDIAEEFEVRAINIDGELLDPQTLDTVRECIWDDTVLYIPCKKEFKKPFAPAYKDIGELIDEIKKLDIASELPEDFDWAGHIRLIMGQTDC